MVHVLDTLQLGRPGIIAATALETSDGLALFDTGPESTYSNIVQGLADSGASAGDVRHVFLSHIHFDHAGAAWRFAELGATVYVHPRGAPHLKDPRKLLESATRIFGNEMEKLWGRVAPVPQDRLRILEDQDVVQLGDLEIRALATPGHASHHHVYHWDENVFGGDVAGVQLGAGPPIPPFVPPELDIEAWRKSIAVIRDLNPAQLYLPHFGLARGAIAPYLDALEERVVRWSEWLRDRVLDNNATENLPAAFAEYEARDLREGGATFAQVADYEAADPSYMAVTAARRYWQKQSPAASNQS